MPGRAGRRRRHLHGRPPPPALRRQLPPECRHLDRLLPEPHVRETEAPADDPAVSKQSFDLVGVRRRADIEVFRPAAEEEVADAAAYEVGDEMFSVEPIEHTEGVGVDLLAGDACAPPVARPPAGSSKMNCNARIGAMRVGLVSAALLIDRVCMAVSVEAAEHPSLPRRVLCTTRSISMGQLLLPSSLASIRLLLTPRRSSPRVHAWSAIVSKRRSGRPDGGPRRSDQNTHRGALASRSAGSAGGPRPGAVPREFVWCRGRALRRRVEARDVAVGIVRPRTLDAARLVGERGRP